MIQLVGTMLFERLTVCSVLILCVVADLKLSSYPAEECFDGIIAYRMTLKTFWTAQNFPKSYPTWRPPAQWSTVYGHSHDETHHMFRFGEMASPALQIFAEWADPSSLAQKTEDRSVFDQFVAPAIKQGQGETAVDIFLDRNHTLVSAVCKLVPSPDWFVGVNSYNLCREGRWVDHITLYLDPLDAGTDGGLTFTAPRWRSRKPQGVSRHTARWPSHPAASFFYPHRRELPPIAAFTLTKIKEFSMYDLLEPTTESYYPTSEGAVDALMKDMSSSTSYSVEKNTLNPLEISTIPDFLISYSNVLSSSASSILSRVASNFQLNEHFYPKLFRPKLNVTKPEKKRFSPGNSSNLLQSRLPTKNDTTRGTSRASHFNW